MLGDDALTADEVADILHVGKNFVYRLAQSGELTSYRIGRKLRFTLRDVEAYLQSSRQGRGMGDNVDSRMDASPVDPPPAENRCEFILAGNDLAGDIFANYLNAAGVPVTRSYVSSYIGLVDVYCNRADAALVDLYDRKTNSYNIPYVQRLVPGVPVVVVRLFRRSRGFVVARGNPKSLTTWGGLLREGVRLANRERGCGERVLLDEKLISLEARPQVIAGYERVLPSSAIAASYVAQGIADVGVGTQRMAHQVEGLDFVPLQTEWLDLVVAKGPRSDFLVRHIKQLAADRYFQREFDGMEDCDTTSMGAIVYEC